MEEFVIEKTVTEEMLAVNVGSGSLRVLATPVVATMMENASSCLADTMIAEGITTVGVSLDLKHTSPPPVGAKVKVQAVCTENDGRTFHFQCVAFDDAGEIARCNHTRVSVKAEKFQEKADHKYE